MKNKGDLFVKGLVEVPTKSRRKGKIKVKFTAPGSPQTDYVFNILLRFIKIK